MDKVRYAVYYDQVECKLAWIAFGSRKAALNALKKGLYLAGKQHPLFPEDVEGVFTLRQMKRKGLLK